MSDFRFGCPHCGQRIEGDAGYRGRQITCPTCSQLITVPSPVAKKPIAGLHKPAATAASQTPKLSSLALISFVCSFGLAAGSIPGILCGHFARRQLRRNQSLRGNGLAVAGLVISYFSLVLSIALLTVGFLVLKPKIGHQLTAAEQGGNTPASRLVDEVKIGDAVSESAHGIKTRFSGSGKFSDRPVRDAINGGFISYDLKVDPARPMKLYCTYWGNDSTGRRFDILINDVAIATQTLDYNDPGHFFDVEYTIPQKLTRGQNTVTVTFQAYPRKTVGGIYACQMRNGDSR